MRIARLTALLLGVLASSAMAQADSASKSARILTHTFVTPSREFVRVRLESTQTYRVQLNRARVRLEVRPVSRGVQPPRVRAIFSGEDLQVFVVDPRVTSEYEIRVLEGEDRPIRLTVDRTTPKPLNQ